jgi:hypothetical protein
LLLTLHSFERKIYRKRENSILFKNFYPSYIKYVEDDSLDEAKILKGIYFTNLKDFHQSSFFFPSAYNCQIDELMEFDVM